MSLIDARLYFIFREGCDVGSHVVVEIATGEFNGELACRDMESLTEDDPAGVEGQYLQVGAHRFEVERKPGWKFRVIDLDGLQRVARMSAEGMPEGLSLPGVWEQVSEPEQRPIILRRDYNGGKVWIEAWLDDENPASVRFRAMHNINSDIISACESLGEVRAFRDDILGFDRAIERAIAEMELALEVELRDDTPTTKRPRG